MLAAGACGNKRAARPEADPAQVTALAAQMLSNTPAVAGARGCTPADLTGAPMTIRALTQLAGQPLEDKPERADWINPAEVDAPSVRALLTPGTDEPTRRQAAAELLGQRSYVVYRVEMVNVPLALEVKELKRGAVGMRAIAYDRSGAATCIQVFNVQNDRDLSEWAQEKTNKALVDPAIAKALREDLKKQLLAKIAQLTAQPTP